ncbi:hypothetical protein CRYUN_Cryun33cG0071800 [Craigia yunnanensis]
MRIEESVRKMDGKSIQTVKKEELSIQLQKPSIPQLENARPSNLRFDRLQPSDQESNEHKRLELDKFVAREAVLDEEFWTAAWLRAESHWEDRPGERYVDNFKRKLAEQKFNAMKRRYKGQHGQTYTCVVTVKEERNVKRTMLKSVVGTLDLAFSICCRESLFLGYGVELVYVHVYRNNGPALKLYQKIGFEMVEMASSQLLKQDMYLLCLKT